MLMTRNRRNTARDGIARINSHMANHHEFEAQRNRNMAQALETQDQDPVLSRNLRLDAELNKEMASEEFESAKAWKERLLVQKAKEKQQLRLARQAKQRNQQKQKQQRQAGAALVPVPAALVPVPAAAGPPPPAAALQ
ncbi:hypothetical protein FRC18_007912 [Serendipita sp. 400]|nr:hypothetical protein FRC18_007912 [Serendipita sp. 400]